MNKVIRTLNARPRGRISTTPNTTLCVLIPGGLAPQVAVTPLTRLLERSIRRLASTVVGAAGRVRLVAHDAASMHLRTITDPAAPVMHPEGPQDIPSYLRTLVDEGSDCTDRQRQFLIFASVSYLLRVRSLSSALLESAVRNGVCCVGRPTGSLYAIAFAGPDIDMHLGVAPDLLRRVASQQFTASHDSANRSGLYWESVEASGAPHSPVAQAPSAEPTAPEFDAPHFLNAAIAEAFHHPADTSIIVSNPASLKQALSAQRDQSATPWLFNELLNEVEFRTGEVSPLSFPPEVHIAVSSACNIECKFCSYSHATARKDHVSSKLLMKLDFLRHVRTLRLHSGNGEPTANPALADLIRFVEKSYPQISMNFFTNGILLDRPGLIPALVGGHVKWISVSINAANRQSWINLCGSDHFERICKNLKSIYDYKIRNGVSSPNIYGTMVLTKESVRELPQMPELCRRLGVDRFTAIPFFSLGYEAENRLNGGDAYHHIGEDYDHIYNATVDAARQYGVSLELPARRADTTAAFGVEQRVFHDFANVEPLEDRFRALIDEIDTPSTSSSLCHFLWRQAAVGATTRHQGGIEDTHFLYPCLGPLAAVDMSASTAFRFPDETGFAHLWRNPLFTQLREGQTTPGLVEVCDRCRACDSRAPNNLAPMSELLEKFSCDVTLRSTRPES